MPCADSLAGLDPARRPTGGRPPRTRPWLLALVAAAALTVAGCADGASDAGDDPTTTRAEEDFEDMTGEATVVIQARDNAFVPEHVVISTGTEVTFDNRGRNPHNALPVEDGAFTEVPTEDLQPGDEATVAFDEPGEYPYYCSLHGTETAGMIGTIRVTD